ncbi:MAG: hypothetical protein ACT6QS_08150 [Flavobacteriales bacterium]
MGLATTICILGGTGVILSFFLVDLLEGLYINGNESDMNSEFIIEPLVGVKPYYFGQSIPEVRAILGGVQDEYTNYELFGEWNSTLASSVTGLSFEFDSDALLYAIVFSMPSVFFENEDVMALSIPQIEILFMQKGYNKRFNVDGWLMYDDIGIAFVPKGKRRERIDKVIVFKKGSYKKLSADEIDELIKYYLPGYDPLGNQDK